MFLCWKSPIIQLLPFRKQCIIEKHERYVVCVLLALEHVVCALCVKLTCHCISGRYLLSFFPRKTASGDLVYCLLSRFARLNTYTVSSFFLRESKNSTILIKIKPKYEWHFSCLNSNKEVAGGAITTWTAKRSKTNVFTAKKIYKHGTA